MREARRMGMGAPKEDRRGRFTLHRTPGEDMTWQIGDVTVTRVEEHVMELPTRYLVPGLTADLVAAAGDWAAPHFTADCESMMLSIHAFVVQSGDRTIVVDTCIGDPGQSLPGDPEFADRLDAAIDGGLDTVDTVLCTHLHFDHVGLNTREVGGEWVPTFPNARYLVSSAELEHTRSDDHMGVWDTSIAPLEAAGLLTGVAMDHEIDERVRLVPTPGHTPGHVCVRIDSGGESAIITGDMSHSPLQFAHPDCSAAPADDDEPTAIATRVAFIAEHLDTDTLLLGTHFAPPTSGHLVSGASGTEFR